MHALFSNLANRQTDKRTRAKTCTCSFVRGNNKKCGRRVRLTQYAPARLRWHRYSILFPEWKRGRDETYIRVRRPVDTDSIKTLVHAFVMLRLDYCNAVVAVSRILLISVWRSEKYNRFSADHGVYCQCQCIRNTYPALCDNFRLHPKAARTN